MDKMINLVALMASSVFCDSVSEGDAGGGGGGGTDGQLAQLDEYIESRVAEQVDAKTRDAESKLVSQFAAHTQQRTSPWLEYQPGDGKALVEFVRAAGAAYRRDGHTRRIDDFVDKEFHKRFSAPFIEKRGIPAKQNRAHDGLAYSEDGGDQVLERPLFQEILELLRNRLVLPRLGVTVIGMTSGTLDLPRETQKATFGYAGEATAIPGSKPDFDQKRLTAKKLAGLVPITNDWLRRGPIGGERWVANKMLTDFAVKMERHILTGDPDPGKPETLFEGIKAANKLELTATGVDAAKARVTDIEEFEAKMDELVDLITADGVNVPEENLRVLMNIKGKNFLRRQRDQGVLRFPELRLPLDQMMYIQYPCVVSNMLRNDRDDSGQGDADETRIFVGDFSNYWIGILADMSLEVSRDARFETDEIVYRLIGEHDGKHTRDDRIGCLSTDIFSNSPAAT